MSSPRPLRTLVAMVCSVATLVPLTLAAPASGAAVTATDQAGINACRVPSPALRVTGREDDRYRPRLATATAIDARGAEWVQVDDHAVFVKGNGALCWSGGIIRGTYPSSTPWRALQRTAALEVANPASTIENLRVHNYGDGIRIRGNADDFIVRGAWESLVRDDCVENDRLFGGVIAQSLFDGCYVGFSARPVRANRKSDGRDRTWTISDSLVRLRPMPTVFRGSTPGHGGFFKWDPDNGRAPKLALYDNVFRADQAPNDGSLGLPDGYPVSCARNTIVWLGDGPFPAAASWRAKCPDTRIVTTASTWQAAVQRWMSNQVVSGSDDPNPNPEPNPTTTTTTTTRPQATTTTTTTRPQATTTTTTTRPQATTTTTTTTTTTPPVTDPPVTDPPSTPSECLGRTPLDVVSGLQSDRFSPTISRATAFDARFADWVQVDAWPVSIKGSGPVCWNGGRITGTYSASTSWDTFHSTGAFNVENPDSVIENVTIHNYGDGIRLRQGATNWTIRGAHESFLHDDCVENDKLGSGVIEDSLFDGCYVGLSTRPSSSDSSSDGRRNTMTMRGSLLRLQPMPTVYKGPAPGHGGFFKWDNDSGRSPKLALYDNVLRVDQLPNHGSLGLPDGYAVSCARNTIVWLGGGSFPEAASWLAKCPDTRIVTSRAAWDDAVAAWRARH